MDKANKDKRINIKIESNVHAKFDQYCKERGTTMSDELRRYIFKCINQVSINV